MTPQQVAELTGFTLDHLKKLRYEKRVFPYYKPTDRTVLYDRIEVEAVLRASRVPNRDAP